MLDMSIFGSGSHDDISTLLSLVNNRFFPIDLEPNWKKPAKETTANRNTVLRVCISRLAASSLATR